MSVGLHLLDNLEKKIFCDLLGKNCVEIRTQWNTIPFENGIIYSPSIMDKDNVLTRHMLPLYDVRVIA